MGDVLNLINCSPMVLLKSLSLFSKINKRTLWIRNSAGPNSVQVPCVKCKHFIPPEHSFYPEDPKPDLKIGKCGLFGEQNVVTGKIIYDFALECRNNHKKCDYNGKHFKPIEQS